MTGDLVAADLLVGALTNLKRVHNQAEDHDAVLTTLIDRQIDALRALIVQVNQQLAKRYPDPQQRTDAWAQQKLAFMLAGGKYNRGNDN